MYTAMNSRLSLLAISSVSRLFRRAPFSSSPISRPNTSRRSTRFMIRGATRRRPTKQTTAVAVPTDDDNVPSFATVKNMPVSLRGMDNTALTTLGAMGNHKALQEMIVRHVMATDNVSYEEATKVYNQIEKKNHEYEHIMALPFQASILMCAFGFLSIPLVFDLSSVEYFNEQYVTAEHPPPKELETALEVGSWSWNWMEPVLGTSTFLLLSLQYMRMHLQHLGVHPFTTRMKRMRGRHLADAFPKYSEELLIAYSDSSPFYNSKDLWL